MPHAPQRLERVFHKYEPPLYFVTLNTRRRRQVLANEKVHSAFVKFAEKAGSRGMLVGRYVIMPDHIHLFVLEWDGNKLSQWVRSLKRTLSSVIDLSPPRWQRGFFDHVIRRSESYADKWGYVRSNPVRAKLIDRSEDWPWQGEVSLLEAL